MRMIRLLTVLLAGVLTIGCQPSSDAPTRLTTAEAFELIGDQLGMPDYRSGLSGAEARTAQRVTDVTPDDVWDRLGGQVFQVGYDWLVLVRHGQAQTLCQRAISSTLEDAVVTDLNQDGNLEIVAQIDWGLSGRYFPYVMIWDIDAPDSPKRVLLSRAGADIHLRKIDDQLVEIVVPVRDAEPLVGTITALQGGGVDEVAVTFDTPSLDPYNIQVGGDSIPLGVFDTP
jgi:hypothetical protein